MIETEFAERRIFTIIWVTCMKKNSEIRTSIKKLLAKYWLFKKLPLISHIHKNHNFSRIIIIFLEKMLLPYKFQGQGSSVRGILFFHFARCEPLMHKISLFDVQLLLHFWENARTILSLNFNTIHSAYYWIYSIIIFKCTIFSLYLLYTFYNQY